MHEVLVNRLGGLSLPRKSVVRLTDRPDMTLDVYRGRRTTIQQQSFKNESRGSLQKTIATCSKCETNLILAYLHSIPLHSSSQSQKCRSRILSDKSKFLLRISKNYRFYFSNTILSDGTLLKSFPYMNCERAENYLY